MSSFTYHMWKSYCYLVGTILPPLNIMSNQQDPIRTNSVHLAIGVVFPIDEMQIIAATFRGVGKSMRLQIIMSGGPVDWVLACFVAARVRVLAREVVASAMTYKKPYWMEGHLWYASDDTHCFSNNHDIWCWIQYLKLNLTMEMIHRLWSWPPIVDLFACLASVIPVKLITQSCRLFLNSYIQHRKLRIMSRVL